MSMISLMGQKEQEVVELDVNVVSTDNDGRAPLQENWLIHEDDADGRADRFDLLKRQRGLNISGKVNEKRKKLVAGWLEPLRDRHWEFQTSCFVRYFSDSSEIQMFLRG
jgi:hypothetical protein